MLKRWQDVLKAVEQRDDDEAQETWLASTDACVVTIAHEAYWESFLLL